MIYFAQVDYISNPFRLHNRESEMMQDNGRDITLGCLVYGDNRTVSLGKISFYGKQGE